MKQIVARLTSMTSIRIGASVRTVKMLDTTAGGRFSGSRNKCCTLSQQTIHQLISVLSLVVPSIRYCTWRD